MRRRLARTVESFALQGWEVWVRLGGGLSSRLGLGSGLGPSLMPSRGSGAASMNGYTFQRARMSSSSQVGTAPEKASMTQGVQDAKKKSEHYGPRRKAHTPSPTKRHSVTDQTHCPGPDPIMNLTNKTPGQPCTPPDPTPDLQLSNASSRTRKIEHIPPSDSNPIPLLTKEHPLPRTSEEGVGCPTRNGQKSQTTSCGANPWAEGKP